MRSAISGIPQEPSGFGGKVAGASVFADHDFSGLHYHIDGVALLERQFVGAGAGDDALDQVLADADYHMGHDVAEFQIDDRSRELIARRK